MSIFSDLHIFLVNYFVHQDYDFSDYLRS